MYAHDTHRSIAIWANCCLSFCSASSGPVAYSWESTDSICSSDRTSCSSRSGSEADRFVADRFSFMNPRWCSFSRSGMFSLKRNACQWYVSRACRNAAQWRRENWTWSAGCWAGDASTSCNRPIRSSATTMVVMADAMNCGQLCTSSAPAPWPSLASAGGNRAVAGANIWPQPRDTRNLLSSCKDGSGAST